MRLQIVKEKHDIENTIKKYTNTISKIAYSYTKNKETAEDITQNVFLKYMISEHTFHDDEHKKAWLIRVTINECKKHFRRLSYQPKSYPKTPEPEEYHDVYSAVMDLPQNYRMVIHLHYEEQDNESYELALNVLKNENDTFSIGDIILKAKIKYLDGTVENKKIKIAANDDISSGLQMKIL
ncbi:MAG: RNA polymerase subunit sigma-24 [Lachnospiraceae bacterium]|nr:RNA polymerase subunit sigma-24 [Lachnospiraceae bacterium]